MQKIRLKLTFLIFILPIGGFFAQSQFSAPIFSDCYLDTREVVLLDINNDEFIDLASISFTNNSATVMLGDGLGKFGCQNTFDVGLLPTDLAFGDFNNDEHQDLVILNQNIEDEIMIFLGNSDGNFSNDYSFDIGGPNDVVVADFNLDNSDDLAIAEGNSNVKISLGDGMGVFGQGGIFEVGEAPIVLFTDDLNRDDIPDLVVGHGLSNDFLVMLGMGDSSFELADFYPTGGNPYSFQFREVTGDIFKDLIVAVNSEESVVRIFEGNGAGGFSFFANIPTPFEPLGVVCADFDNDQKNDIAVTLDSEEENNILIFKGSNSINYSLLTTLSASGIPSEVFAFDIDKNGYQDIVVNDFRVSVFLNNAITNGIRDWVADAELVVFPNPAFGNQISIQTKNIPSGKYDLKIIDILGKTQNSRSLQLFENQLITLNIQNLSKGLYSLLISNNEQQFSEKIVIR